jgi:hypothetical protein
MRAARGMCKLQILRSGQTDRTGQLVPAYCKSIAKTAKAVLSVSFLLVMRRQSLSSVRSLLSANYAQIGAIGFD